MDLNTDLIDIELEKNMGLCNMTDEFFCWFINSILHKHNKNILVVTHGGVINFALCYFEDKNNFQPADYLNKCLHTKIDNSAILRVKDYKSGMTILKNTHFYKLPKSK